MLVVSRQPLERREGADDSRSVLVLIDPRTMELLAEVVVLDASRSKVRVGIAAEEGRVLIYRKELLESVAVSRGG